MKMKKRLKRILSCVLAIALILSLMLPVMAVTSLTTDKKQEVVYINLDYDGRVEKVYVVNIFDLTEEGKIIDHGNYTALRNMTSNDEIRFEDQTVTIDTNEDRLYYEGILASDIIPWIFSIRYYLDGVECSGDSLAGKSGNIRLDVDISQNPECNSTFFENYALQISLSLDTEKCKNTMAEDSTRANIGKNEQFSYIVLPGEGKTFSVTTVAENFEMDGISINALPLNMKVDIDLSDNKEFQDKMQELKDAAKDFDEAANDLLEGSQTLSDGAGELKDSSYELSDGVDTLNEGISSIADGVIDLKNGVNALHNGAGTLYDGTISLKDGAQELFDSTDALNDGADDLYKGAKDIYDGAKELETGLDSLTDQNPTLRSMSEMLFANTLSAYTAAGLNKGNYSINLATTLNELQAMMYARQIELSGATENTEDTTVREAGATQVEDLPSSQEDEPVSSPDILSDPCYAMIATMAYYKGVIAYTSGVSSAASGASRLAAGAADLKDGVAELQDASGDLSDAIETAKDGAETLSDGAEELWHGTEELYDNILILQDGTIDLADGILDLHDGVAALLDGAIELYDGTIQICDGVLELRSGTMKFCDKTANINQEMEDRIQEAIDDMLGGDFDVRSFVSDKNTDVEFIQFVIQTPKITLPDPELPDEPEVTLTLWQKILNLFGLYKTK